MKIALFHNLPSGGAKRHTYEQLKELSKRGHTIVEYAPNTAELEYCSFTPFIKEQQIYQASKLNFMQRRIPLATPYIHAIQLIAHLRQTEQVNLEIAKDIDRGNFDLALVKDCRVMPSPFLLRFLATKSVFQCHHVQRLESGPTREQRLKNGSPGLYLKRAYYYPARAGVSWYLHQNETRNIRSATRVLTNSQYSKGILFDLFGINANPIYPGIDAQLFAPQGCAEADYVLSVGSLTFNKGHRFLVSSLALIDPASRPSLFIAANSRNPQEEQTIRRLAAEANVDLHIETIFDAERLVKVYNQAKVFVYAPLQEALGLAPLEAMACGTPVVAVGEAGVKETVVDGQTGYAVKRDPQLFAEKLELLLLEENKRRQMGQASVDYVRRQWTWQKAVDHLEQELETVVSSYSEGKTEVFS